MSTREAYEVELEALLRGFADNVRGLRERTARDYSQEDLADAARLHRTEISKIERAQRDPRLSTLLILADALGASLDDLAKGVQVPKERRPSPRVKRARAIDR
jgi:transcriptional regulator with XRE-family HTH domain